MRLNRILLILLLALIPMTALAADNNGDQTIKTVKKERIHIRKGNKLYDSKRYAEAEVEYRKALQVNSSSPIAMFNLATSLIRQGYGASKEDKNNPMNQASTLLQNLVKTTNNKDLRSKSYYDLGNMAYNDKQYDKAVDFYKNSLRNNPNDDQARDNLRLAQLKMKNKNQDKNKNQNKNKNDKNKDKDKQKQNQNQNQNKNQQNKQQQKQQTNMSQQNIEQILKTMQDEEQATQQKMNASKARMQQNERRRTNNQW
jgi:Ca-activated chloride channel family protein